MIKYLFLLHLFFMNWWGVWSFPQSNLGQELPEPTGLKVRTFQREIELSWDKADEETHWEVVLNDVAVFSATTNAYVIEYLQPGERYKVKIRAVKHGNYSAFTPVKNIYTERMAKKEDDISRVPHLRTLLGKEINVLGNYPSVLRLYYNDLYAENAQITYYLNGAKITPQHNSIHFSQKGIQLLKIIVREAADREWELEYKINIK